MHLVGLRISAAFTRARVRLAARQDSVLEVWNTGFKVVISPSLA
jgi:hypothetical protein